MFYRIICILFSDPEQRSTMVPDRRLRRPHVQVPALHSPAGGVPGISVALRNGNNVLKSSFLFHLLL